MFFFFSKILLFLIAPVTWVVFYLLRAVFIKNAGKKRKSVIAAVVLLLFFSNTFIFDRFMNAWEVKAIPESMISGFDAAILLTGMTTYDVKNDRLEFNDRTDRLMQTIKLYKSNKVKKIILCGGPATISGNDTLEALKLKSYLEQIGIPDSAIISEDKSRNTHENAVFLKPILSNTFHPGKFLLVTSAWHLRRARACFTKEGIATTPFSTDRYSGPVKWDIDYLFLPSSATLFNWEKLTHEWFGCITYYLRGYI